MYHNVEELIRAHEWYRDIYIAKSYGAIPDKNSEALLALTEHTIAALKRLERKENNDKEIS